MPGERRLSQEKKPFHREQCQNFLTRIYRSYEDKKIMVHAETGEIVIDVGCGEGIILEKFLRKCPQKKVIGVDILVKNARICKEHKLPALVNDVYSLCFKDDSVDRCLFTQTLEHLNKPDEALLEIRRVLKPGGTVIIVVPNDIFFKVARLATFKWKMAFYPAGHVKQWTPGSVRKLLERLGFRLVLQKNLPFRFWMISLNHMVVAQKG